MAFIDDLAKILPIADVYKDLLQPSTKELGEGLASVAKTARFIFAPFEYMGSQHDRYLAFLKRVAEKSKDRELIEPHPQISGRIFDGIKYLDEQSLLFDMFAELLSKAIQKDTASTAHPAFPVILSQLSPDEALLLYRLKSREYDYWEQVDYDSIKGRFTSTRVIKNDFPINDLQYPQNYILYINHLANLQIAGVPEYLGQEMIMESGKHIANKVFRKAIFLEFGVLFSNCCIPDNGEKILH
jgi:hypothetical protein